VINRELLPALTLNRLIDRTCGGEIIIFPAPLILPKSDGQAPPPQVRPCHDLAIFFSRFGHNSHLGMHNHRS
jgi:hypothetical protein